MKILAIVLVELAQEMEVQMAVEVPMGLVQEVALEEVH
jgi:hypothetical protein